MPQIIWDETFSVKVEEIDAQHKKWIEIINQLHNCLMSPDGLHEITIKTLEAMVDYGVFHFSFEEDYLRKIGYPDIEAHKKEHDLFLNKIMQYRDAERAGKLVLNSEIMRILQQWLKEHILNEDKKYSAFIAS